MLVILPDVRVQVVVVVVLVMLSRLVMEVDSMNQYWVIAFINVVSKY